MRVVVHAGAGKALFILLLALDIVIVVSRRFSFRRAKKKKKKKKEKKERKVRRPTNPLVVCI